MGVSLNVRVWNRVSQTVELFERFLTYTVELVSALRYFIVNLDGVLTSPEGKRLIQGLAIIVTAKANEIKEQEYTKRLASGTPPIAPDLYKRIHEVEEYHATDKVLLEMLDLVKDNKMIMAIKLHRDATGSSLKSSKGVADTMRELIQRDLRQ